MANRDSTTVPIEGETRLGGFPPSVAGTFYVASNGAANHGSVLALDSVSSVGVQATWYFFVDSSGVLRVSSSYPTNTNTSGSAV